MSMVEINSTQDVRDQSLLISLSDGSQLSLTLNDLNFWYLDALVASIQYATQLGASLILLLALFLLTKSNKRANILYILNSLALAINSIYMVLMCCYYVGPFNDIYNFFSADFTGVPSSAYGVSIAAVIASTLLFLVIQTSLFIQIYVVCINLRKIYRLALLASSAIFGTVAITLKFYLSVINIKVILDPNQSSSLLQQTHKAYIVAMTVSVFWCSAIFIGKLGFAIHQRKKLGLRQWGSMQIIFTMGCQTMIIPAIFSITQHFVLIPGLSSFDLTLVAILLPLSSLWASSSVNTTARPGVPGHTGRRITPSYQGLSDRGNSKNLSISITGTTDCRSDADSPILEQHRRPEDMV